LQFIQGVAGDEFYITMQCGMEAEAAKLGVSVKTQGAQKFDPRCKSHCGLSCRGKPDAILVAPTDVTAMQAPLKAAAEAGIEDRSRRHHPRRSLHRRFSDCIGQRGRRPGGL
jgi:ribose transport system substrate-binding protein